MRSSACSLACVLLLCGVPAESEDAAPAARQPALPEQTSPYNHGGSRYGGRYRDEAGRVKRFALLAGKTPLHDGGGRILGTVTDPVMLNAGAQKEMAVEGRSEKGVYLWAWSTDAGSGWIARSAVVDPPQVDAKAAADRDPKPPREAETALRIDAAGGRARLKGLVHVNSQGVLPRTGGNKGDHYGGRSPGPRDYVYLLFAVPNVQRGGVAKDSIPDGGEFVQGLDDDGKPIVEVMTMYLDLSKPVPVTFLYGREKGGSTYGWIARANVGER